MPRKRASARYLGVVQQRRSIVSRGREPELPPADYFQAIEITSQQCILISRGEREKKMTAAAAMIGLVAAIFRLAVDASRPMKIWWSTMINLVHQHTK